MFFSEMKTSESKQECCRTMLSLIVCTMVHLQLWLGCSCIAVVGDAVASHRHQDRMATLNVMTILKETNVPSCSWKAATKTIPHRTQSSLRTMKGSRARRGHRRLADACTFEISP